LNYTLKQKQSFLERHNKHKGLVKKYAERISQFYPTLTELLEIIKQHDDTKLQEENIHLYILFNLQCRGKYQMTNDESIAYKKVREFHGKLEKHHPDFYKDHKEIPVLYLAEMACDWCAVGEELGSNPIDFYNKVIGKTLHLSEDQSLFIYKVINKIWY